MVKNKTSEVGNATGPLVTITAQQSRFHLEAVEDGSNKEVNTQQFRH